MVSFKLTTEQRSALYYNKYEYKVRFKVKAIGRSRYCKNIYQFNRKIKDLKSKGWMLYDISPEDLLVIKKFLNWKDTVDKSKLMIRLDINSFSVYSNDLAFLRDIHTNLFNLAPAKFSKVYATGIKGVIYFKRTPPSRYRVYFKFTKVSEDFNVLLKEFMERYKDTDTPFIPNKALTTWLENSNRSLWYKIHVSQAFSIGYNNESDLVLLMLIIPEVLGQSFKLEKRNEP